MKKHHNIKKHIMKTLKYKFVIILFTVVCSALQAQKPYDEKVTVIAPYQPTISDANKINVQPVYTDTVLVTPRMTYQTLTRKYSTTYTADPIKPARVGDINLAKLYKFLVKAGFGNYTSPYGEFFVNNTYSRSYSIGGHLKHHSYLGKFKDWAYPGNSENLAEFYGKKFFKQNEIGGGIGYKRNVYHYYGFKPGDYPDIITVLPLEKDMYKQRFNLINANVYFKSINHPDSLKLNYAAGFKYYFLNDYYKTSENAIDFTADINKDLHLFKITSSQFVGLQAQVKYCFDQDSLIEKNAGLISLKPYIKTTFKGFNFNLGVDISVLAANNAKLYFYPIADVQFNIVKNILIVFAGIKGNLQQNTFYSTISENPYINSYIPISYTSTTYDIFGGIKSDISKTMNFSAAVSYARIKNMPLYVTDTNLVFRNKFNVIHDSARLFNVRGEFVYHKDERFKVLVGGNFYHYKMDNELKAWHKPIFDAYVDFWYNIHDKFIITAGITGRSNIYTKTFKRTDAGIVAGKKIFKGYADASLGFEYRYSKILSAFININNLANIKYYTWNNYRAYGFNMMAGVTYAF